MGLDIYFKMQNNEFFAKYQNPYKHLHDLQDKVEELKDAEGYEDALAQTYEFSDCIDASDVEVAYFRKCNFLLPYFGYEDAENCENVPVTLSRVKEFIDDVDMILATQNPDDRLNMAKDIIPTLSGFFFGNTDYNDIYFSDLRYCRDELEKMLDSNMLDDVVNGDATLVIHCWW